MLCNIWQESPEIFKSSLFIVNERIAVGQSFIHRACLWCEKWAGISLRCQCKNAATWFNPIYAHCMCTAVDCGSCVVGHCVCQKGGCVHFFPFGFKALATALLWPGSVRQGPYGFPRAGSQRSPAGLALFLPDRSHVQATAILAATGGLLPAQ